MDWSGERGGADVDKVHDGLVGSVGGDVGYDEVGDGFSGGLDF